MRCSDPPEHAVASACRCLRPRVSTPCQGVVVSDDSSAGPVIGLCLLAARICVCLLRASGPVCDKNLGVYRCIKRPSFRLPACPRSRCSTSFPGALSRHRSLRWLPSSEAAITQPALSAATRSSRLGVAAIQMATAEVSSCTAQHCSNVSSTNQSSSSPRAISTRFPRSTITLSSHASCRSNQRRVCCCVVLPGEVGRAVIAYTSHASLRARCASSASPSASRTGRCSHPFCIVQGGCFHPLDAITPSMSTPTRNGSMTDT